MIGAVVFDVDGVLIEDGVFAGMMRERVGSDAGFFQGPFKDCVLGRADLRDEIAPFIATWGWPESVDECLRIWFEADSKLNEALLTTAAQLRASGLPCYVASTQERHRAEYLEHALGLGPLFDGLFFSCHAGVTKPDRAFFEHCTASIAMPPASILFFDDHEPNVAGARSAGWNAELYKFGDDVRVALRRYNLAG